jgi:hypothetical protein
VHSAPFKANSKGHVTGNSVYVQNNGTQRRTRFDDHLDVHKITEAEKTQMEVIDRLKNQNSDGTGNLGRKEPHSSQPDSRRNTLELSDNIHTSLFSSTARDRHLGIGAGFGSAIKTRKKNDTENQTPPGRTPPGGAGSHAGHRTSPGGPPPDGSASNAGQQNSDDESPPGGSESFRRARGSRTRNQDEPSQDNLLAKVLKGLAGQMADITHNRSYSGAGHGVKETYDVQVPASYNK